MPDGWGHSGLLLLESNPPGPLVADRLLRAPTCPTHNDAIQEVEPADLPEMDMRLKDGRELWVCSQCFADWAGRLDLSAVADKLQADLGYYKQHFEKREMSGDTAPRVDYLSEY